MITRTFEQKAWATSPEHITGILNGDVEPALQNMDMTDVGWVFIGTATISVTYESAKEVKLSAVQQCHEAIKKVRADAEVKIAHLDQMIQNLLAIEYTPPASADTEDDVSF